MDKTIENIKNIEIISNQLWQDYKTVLDKLKRIKNNEKENWEVLKPLYLKPLVSQTNLELKDRLGEYNYYQNLRDILIKAMLYDEILSDELFYDLNQESLPQYVKNLIIN